MSDCSTLSSVKYRVYVWQESERNCLQMSCVLRFVCVAFCGAVSSAEGERCTDVRESSVGDQWNWWYNFQCCEIVYLSRHICNSLDGYYLYKCLSIIHSQRGLIDWIIAAVEYWTKSRFSFWWISIEIISFSISGCTWYSQVRYWVISSRYCLQSVAISQSRLF